MVLLRPDPTDRADMTAEQRLDEVAGIFAREILRLHGRAPAHCLFREQRLDLVTPADCDAATWRRIEHLRAQARGGWEMARRLDDEPGDLDEELRHLNARYAGLEAARVDPIEAATEREKMRTAN